MRGNVARQQIASCQKSSLLAIYFALHRSALQSAVDERSIGPVLGREDDGEAVGILERHPVLGPVRVGGRDGVYAQARRDRLDRFVVPEIKHEQRFWVRRGSAVAPAGGEL